MTFQPTSSAADRCASPAGPPASPAGRPPVPGPALPALRLTAVSFAAAQPALLTRFWSGVLGWRPVGGDTVVPGDDRAFRLRFVSSAVPRTTPNRAHFDLASESLEQQRDTVARALALGGRHLDVGQLPEEEHVVLADPEGNEFCVIEAGNNFLAGCGLAGALSCDGSQAVGYFWSEALGWPLVWDENEETAIQSPHGGTKISWGGPPIRPRTTPDRVHFELTVTGDLTAEIDRLLALGATRPTAPAISPAGITLADPDGTTFTLIVH